MKLVLGRDFMVQASKLNISMGIVFLLLTSGCQEGASTMYASDLSTTHIEIDEESVAN